MNAIIQKSNNLKGTVLVPASKSQTIRGLILGLLSNGISLLTNPLQSGDITSAIKICKKMGADIKIGKTQISVKNKFPIEPKARKINTGDSGITTRFILPVLGLRKETKTKIILDCSRQMRARPAISLVDTLNRLGMDIRYLKAQGKLPVSVSGKLLGGKAVVSGITSQFISALLLSLPLAPNDSEIKVKNLRERPYVEMTLSWLKDLGIRYSHSRLADADVFKIPGRQKYHAFKKNIPGDFSSASYFFALGCLAGKNIALKGLDLKDPQGDKRLIGILKAMGADIKLAKTSILIKGGCALKGIKIDASDIPDLLPTLAVIGTRASGKIVIANVPQARIKETDRIKSMAEGLRKMGAKINVMKDGLIIHQSVLKGAKVSGFNDHRTVMALTLAGMLASGKTIITGAEAVNKTYPDFFKTMTRLGAKVKLSK